MSRYQRGRVRVRVRVRVPGEMEEDEFLDIREVASLIRVLSLTLIGRVSRYQ